MAVDVQKQMTDVRADLQSHPYDLSERHLFSLKAGQLIPVANWQCVPGDYFEIDPVAFMRTQKLNTAAFARMRLHLDFFFVPYWQMFHEFPQMKYQRQDPTSANQYNKFAKMSPYMSLQALYSQILHVNNTISPAAQQTIATVDEFGYNVVANSARLCDLLGYGNLQHCFDPVSSVSGDTVDVYNIPDGGYASTHVNLWPWAAYQKIWNDFYRNDVYDIAVDPHIFNFDDCSCVDLVNADVYAQRNPVSSSYSTPTYFNVFDGLFKLRYRQWKKDYFTGLFPDKQFGDVSMVVGSSSLHLSSPAGGTTSTPLVFGDTNSVTLDPGEVSYSGGSVGLRVLSGISALDIRRAELLQIWKEKTLRAGNKTKSQQIAHFGVQSDYIPDDHVRHLGGSSQLLDINEVVSTSNDNTGTSLNNGLGELGGKGTSLLNGSKIRFHVKDDGIIMCIASVLPESSYNSFGLQHSHTRIDPFDYFTPAFQNLGFEAITRAELDAIHIKAGELTDVIGYAPPYYDLKQGIDRVHGEFNSVDASVFGSSYLWNWQNTARGTLSYFDAARREAVQRVKTLPFFYVDPHVLDSIFDVSANSFEQTDQFWIASYFHISAVRPISVLGLPNF